MEKSFWEERYTENNTGWDIGEISTPLKSYIDQLENKELKILVPGAGFGHEVTYLFKNGFKNVFLLDFSKNALDSFKINNPDFPVNQILEADFFSHNKKYDLIIEQTLFCAINPENRRNYVSTIYNLLNEGGKLVGLLFNCEFLNGPPFGGNKEEYFELFSQKFKNIKIETCYNSIEARKGRELFIQIVK